MMSRPNTRLSLLALFLFAACGESTGEGEPPAVDAAPGQGGDADGDGAALFDPTRVAVIELEIGDAEFDVIYSDRDQPQGFDDFTYVPATMSLDGVDHGIIGLRVKGNSTRRSSQGNYMPFKIDADRYVDTTRIDGVKKVNLHLTEVALVRGDSVLNEYLAYTAWRAHGVAAPRTGWVDLRINGSSVGLYTSVEQVSSPLLERFYESGDEALYKPESPAGSLEDLGDDFSAYENADYKGDDEEEYDHASFLSFIEVINHQPVSEWDAVVDIDSVLDYFAGNVAMGNWDTYNIMQHNFYLYEGETGVFSMLPWDMNEIFVGTAAVCPNEVTRGGGGPGGGPGSSTGSTPLHDHLFADSEIMERYKVALVDFLDGAGSADRFAEAAEAAASAVAPWTTVDVQSIRNEVVSRAQTIKASLDATTICR